MIAYLSGTVINKNEKYAVILTGGVGYRVFLPTSLLAEIKDRGEAAFWIHYHSSEQGTALFGLRAPADLEFFEMLIGVSGVGPKTALAVFNVAEAADLKASIARGESALLSQVSGIGKKTAERIVLELRGKLSGMSLAEANFGSDELEALVVLGYSQAQAWQALTEVGNQSVSSADRIKLALQKLGKKK